MLPLFFLSSSVSIVFLSSSSALIFVCFAFLLCFIFVIAKVKLGKTFVFVFCCAFLVAVAALLRHIFAFIGDFYLDFFLHFLDFHWDEIRRCIIWM